MSYPHPYAASGEPSRYYPRSGEQYWTPQAHNVRRPDLDVGYAPAYYPSQGYSTAGVELKRRNSAPWWTNPEVYPEPRYYYDGPDWASNTRFESSYVSDPQMRGNSQAPRRTWEETALPDKGYDAAGRYRYKRGQTEIPLDRLRSPDVVEDIDVAKKPKEWPIWRRVGVQNVNELTPKVLDGGYMKNLGYIK